MDKKTFIIYKSWEGAIDKMTDEQVGQLFRKIYHPELEITDPVVDILWGIVSQRLDEDSEKYAAKVERINKVNESKRNRDDIVTKSKRNRDDIVSDTDTDTVTDTDKYIKGSTASAAPLPFIDYEEVVNDYNSICVSLPRVTTISDARRKAIRARIRAYGKDKIHKAFEMAEESDFLKGSNSKNWTANFDWILNDRNLAKILDGNYANKGKAPPKQDGFEWLSQQIKEGGFT